MIGDEMRTIKLYINAGDGIAYCVGSTTDKNLGQVLDFYRTAYCLSRDHMFVVVSWE